MNENLGGKTTKKKGMVMPEFFKLEKPKKPVNQEKIFTALAKGEYKKLFESSNHPRYLYWDKFRFKVASDEELTIEDKWYLIRQLRDWSSIELPIQSESGEFFKWLRFPLVEEYLHKIDMFAGGRLFNKSSAISPANRNTLLNRGIIEEAIASSQLEGAHTTRKAAKEFLINKRLPKNESEQMILNNYKTINAITEDYKNQPLSKELLFEMHAMLTENTVDPSEQHRFRKNADEIVVQGQIGSEEYITHVPPKEAFVLKSIENLIEYANDLDNKFTHPILKAIMLHFWIGYIHPFTDGNGRLARSIFYWYLLRKGYWTFMYLPISTIIKKAPLQYAMAYIYSEQDNLDLTYFNDFHIQKIIQSIDEFEEYLDTKIKENKSIDRLLDAKFSLNDRQKQLLHYLVSDLDPSVSVSSHSLLHTVSRQTAIRDLGYLEEKKLIQPKRSGKFVKYYPTERLLGYIAE
jgi:Fic family protein